MSDYARVSRSVFTADLGFFKLHFSPVNFFFFVHALCFIMRSKNDECNAPTFSESRSTDQQMTDHI